MAIKNLRRELAVIGRIKIGGLEGNKRTTKDGKEWQAPVKYDHFQVKTMVRGADGNFIVDQTIQKKLGEKPTDLDVMLLYNDNELNFRTTYALYEGKRIGCKGDGEKAIQINTQTGEVVEKCCPCEKLDQPRGCKAHGTLYCILRDAEITGGVWKYSTTSKNTISNIMSSLDFISLCVGGKIAGLPLTMKLFPKETVTPEGQPTKIWIVGLFYKGNPIEMLENAISLEKRRLEGGIKMELLEYQIREEFKKQIVESEIIDEEEIPEFHPTNEAPTINQVLAPPEPPKQETVKQDQVETPKPVEAPKPIETPKTVETPKEVKLEKPAILKEIATIRTKYDIKTGPFTTLVGSAIGKAIADASKWTDEQAAKILSTLKNKYPDNQGATA